MGITTKTGDKGKTALISGERIFKDDLRIELVGELDELCSFLGTAKSLIKPQADKKMVESIQVDLFTLGAEVASGPLHVMKLKKRITGACVCFLDEQAGILEKALKDRKFCFCLPGENVISGTLDVARAVARRCERKATTLAKKRITRNPHILAYLNRLSDLLYLLARKNEASPKPLKNR